MVSPHLGQVDGAGFFIWFYLFSWQQKSLRKRMIKPMIILFILGGLQGYIGWFMVKSGLVPEKYFVGHVELTTHFIAALGLLCYTLWFALSLLVTEHQKVINTKLKNFLLLITCSFVLSIDIWRIYGRPESGRYCTNLAGY